MIASPLLVLLVVAVLAANVDAYYNTAWWSSVVYTTPVTGGGIAWNSAGGWTITWNASSWTYNSAGGWTWWTNTWTYSYVSWNYTGPTGTTTDDWTWPTGTTTWTFDFGDCYDAYVTYYAQYVALLSGGDADCATQQEFADAIFDFNVCLNGDAFDVSGILASFCAGTDDGAPAILETTCFCGVGYTYDGITTGTTTDDWTWPTGTTTDDWTWPSDDGSAWWGFGSWTAYISWVSSLYQSIGWVTWNGVWYYNTWTWSNSTWVWTWLSTGGSGDDWFFAVIQALYPSWIETTTSGDVNFIAEYGWAANIFPLWVSFNGGIQDWWTISWEWESPSTYTTSWSGFTLQYTTSGGWWAEPVYIGPTTYTYTYGLTWWSGTWAWTYGATLFSSSSWTWGTYFSDFSSWGTSLTDWNAWISIVTVTVTVPVYIYVTAEGGTATVPSTPDQDYSTQTDTIVVTQAELRTSPVVSDDTGDADDNRSSAGIAQLTLALAAVAALVLV